MTGARIGLCFSTVLTAPLREVVSAASGAGFDAITLSPDLFDRARAEGLDDSAIRGLIDDAGLCVTEVDPLLIWIPGHEPSRLGDDPPLVWFAYGPDDFFRVAEVVGARHVNAAQGGDVESLQQVIDGLGALGQRAAAHGLGVCYEFLPWSATPDLARACDVVAAVDAANVGVLLDTWHFFRSGGVPADLTPERLDRIVALQVNDAPKTPGPDLIEETMTSRLMPGDGDIPLTEILSRILTHRPDLVPTVEVFNTRHASEPAAHVARRAAAATRSL